MWSPNYQWYQHHWFIHSFPKDLQRSYWSQGWWETLSTIGKCGFISSLYWGYRAMGSQEADSETGAALGSVLEINSRGRREGRMGQCQNIKPTQRETSSFPQGVLKRGGLSEVCPVCEKTRPSHCHWKGTWAWAGCLSSAEAMPRASSWKPYFLQLGQWQHSMWRLIWVAPKSPRHRQSGQGRRKS